VLARAVRLAASLAANGVPIKRRAQMLVGSAGPLEPPGNPFRSPTAGSRTTGLQPRGGSGHSVLLPTADLLASTTAVDGNSATGTPPRSGTSSTDFWASSTTVCR
jgi:hypothetical protein